MDTFELVLISELGSSCYVVRRNGFPLKSFNSATIEESKEKAEAFFEKCLASKRSETIIKSVTI